jgi:predicted RNA-binding Zn-ribbon protein involved in translation (DUF1610 family)
MPASGAMKGERMDAHCINTGCEFHDDESDLNCSGDCHGEPAIASCKKYRLQSEKWKCVKCDENAPCVLEIIFNDDRLPEHLKGRQRLTRNACPCGEFPSADWQRA